MADADEEGKWSMRGDSDVEISEKIILNNYKNFCETTQ